MVIPKNDDAIELALFLHAVCERPHSQDLKPRNAVLGVPNPKEWAPNPDATLPFLTGSNILENRCPSPLKKSWQNC